MAFSDQALLSEDVDFIRRVAACSAVEISDPDVIPLNFATRYSWRIAAAPGFADAYASALAGGVERPGNDQAVISDAEILAAVQALITSLGDDVAP